MRTGFRQSVAAEPTALRAVRRGFNRWLTGLRWPLGDAYDVLLALSEEVSNAIEHAYPGACRTGTVVIIDNELIYPTARRRIGLTIIDQGLWRPPPAETEDRRRGIPLMRALTDAVDIHVTPVGRRVTMSSRPVPVEAERELALSGGTGLACAGTSRRGRLIA